MHPLEFCELSVEHEEYLVELLCSRGACTLDWFALELDELCRRARAPLNSPSSVAIAPSAALALK